MAESIRVLSWNVNGLRAVQKKGFLEWFSQESPGILCLQETKAQEDQLPDGLKNVEGSSHWLIRHTSCRSPKCDAAG